MASLQFENLFDMEYTYFGYKVELTLSERSYPSFPWSFRIHCPDGGVRHFLGIPNMCVSKRQALRRAWWRCKWLSEGTFDEHYKPMSG